MITAIVLGCMLGLSLFFNICVMSLAFRLAHRVDTAEAKLREVSANKAVDDVYQAIRDSKKSTPHE